jgi:WD40 repeat protein
MRFLLVLMLCQAGLAAVSAPVPERNSVKPTHALPHALKGHTSSVMSVAFSRDGTTLASGSRDKCIKLWDVKTGRETASLTGHAKMV